MQEILRDIISTVPQGYFFDSHFVIEKLAEEYPKVYESEVPKDNLASYHSVLARRIKQLPGSLVEQKEEKSWSKNINGNYSECVLWRRVVQSS
ncbi:MAG TPA: hypothetical protein VFC80_05790 [Sphaerochaeta sp.]|nr:hypothetical protein [Sphaerochaeta sp.]